jgi:proline dehydrogenase
MSEFLLQFRPKDDVSFPGTPGSFDMVVFRGSRDALVKSGLTEEDVESLRTLYEDLRNVCSRARERGVRVRRLYTDWIKYEALIPPYSSFSMLSILGINPESMRLSWLLVGSLTSHQAADLSTNSHLYTGHIKRTSSGKCMPLILK